LAGVWVLECEDGQSLAHPAGPAQADDTFSRAVYCSAFLKSQIEASRQMVSERGAGLD
jgi:hypothetical protein